MPHFDREDEALFNAFVEEVIAETAEDRLETVRQDVRENRAILSQIAKGEVPNSTPLSAIGIDSEEKQLSLARALDEKVNLGEELFFDLYRIKNPTVGDFRKALAVVRKRRQVHRVKKAQTVKLARSDNQKGDASKSNSNSPKVQSGPDGGEEDSAEPYCCAAPVGWPIRDSGIKKGNVNPSQRGLTHYRAPKWNVKNRLGAFQLHTDSVPTLQGLALVPCTGTLPHYQILSVWK